MFWESALLGVLASWLRGGKLKNLSEIDLPGWYLALFAYALQFFLWISFAGRWESINAFAPYLHILSYLPLLAFAALNRKNTGLVIIGLGILLNFVVISANAGAMPVDPAQLAPELQEELILGEGSPLHIAMTDETRLAVLGDIIRVPYSQRRIISIGDIIMSLGIIILLYQGMLTTTKNKGQNKLA